MSTYVRVEDLDVYQKLCRLHTEVCALTRGWPPEERFELAGQARRSPKSAPANLAEKHSDRHVRNKIEGMNRARGEALETVHHLYVAMLKGYIDEATYVSYRERYEECVRMLNGMERSLERHLPAAERRWPDRVAEEDVLTGYVCALSDPVAHAEDGWPEPEPRTLNPEP